MQCPVCPDTRLERAEYEGVRVERCPTCFGVLLSPGSQDSVKRRRNLSPEDLLSEGELMGDHDATRFLDCPSCHRRMAHESRDVPVAFTYDLCPRCSFAWFDLGELAWMQFAYEMSHKGINAAMLQDRWRNMTPEERADFERRVSKLPRGMGDCWFALDGRGGGIGFGYRRESLYFADLL